MRKILLTTLTLIGLSSASFAQMDSLKPISGMSSLEITFNPAAIFNSNNPSNMFGLTSINGLNQGIKYRNWVSPSMAYRGTFLLGLQNLNTAKLLMSSLGVQIEATDTQFEWALQIRPGVEHHFAGSKRLSPYVGGELIFGYGSNKYTQQNLDSNDVIVESTIKNGNFDFSGNNVVWNYANGFTAGAGLLAGFDYYIAKDLYLGLEINYAFVYNQGATMIVETPGNDPFETKRGNNWYFNPSANALVRFGWNF